MPQFPGRIPLLEQAAKPPVVGLQIGQIASIVLGHSPLHEGEGDEIAPPV